MHIYKALIMPSLTVIIILGPIIAGFWHYTPRDCFPIGTAQTRVLGRLLHLGGTRGSRVGMKSDRYIYCSPKKQATYYTKIICLEERSGWNHVARWNDSKDEKKKNLIGVVRFHLFLPSRTVSKVVFHILVFTFQLNNYTNNPLSLCAAFMFGSFCF